MPNVNLFTEAKFKAFDGDGAPLSGGKVYTYEAGTSTPLATYSDSAGTSANTNPVVLDSRGEADIWYQVGKAYKIVLKDSSDTQVWEVDDLGDFDGKVISADQIRAIDGDGLKLFDDGGNGIFIEDGGDIRLHRDINTTDSEQTLNLALDNSGGTVTNYARIATIIKDNTASSEDGDLRIDVINSGALTSHMTLKSDGSLLVHNLSGGDPSGLKAVYYNTSTKELIYDNT